MERVENFNFFIKEIEKLQDYIENEAVNSSNIRELANDKIFDCNRFVTRYIELLKQFEVKSYEQLLSVFQSNQLYSDFESIIKKTFKNWDDAINRINKLYVGSLKIEPGFDQNLRLDEIEFTTIPDLKPYHLKDHSEGYKLIVLLRHFQ
jgi:hypothetical protein